LCFSPDTVLAEVAGVGEAPRGQGRVLFVDDEPEIVRSATPLLERLGYRVRGLASALEAEAVFRAAPDDFDLLVTDLRMPGLGGLDLARRLRSVRPGLPVVLVTGFADGLGDDEARAAGLCAVVRKPWRPEAFARVVRDALPPREPSGAPS